jgi:cyanophycinase
MEEIDRALIGRIGGQAAARVVCLPTASGLEGSRPWEWNAQGEQHFGRMGVKVKGLALINRDDAHNPNIIWDLRLANFFYFSGGNPEHLVESLQNTPAWEAIVRRWRAGAVIAGCSAGAMMLGSATLRMRAVLAGQPPQWQAALGLAEPLVVTPHFDRMGAFIGQGVLRRIVESAPANTTMVGIDEDTALVTLPHHDATRRWQVWGRQSVTIWNGQGERTILQAGASVAL